MTFSLGLTTFLALHAHEIRRNRKETTIAVAEMRNPRTVELSGHISKTLSEALACGLRLRTYGDTQAGTDNDQTIASLGNYLGHSHRD